MSSEWPSSQQQTLLIDGYCRLKYSSNIPLALVRTILLFYNEIFYWKFKGEKLKQFLSTINRQLIASKVCMVNGINIQYQIYPKGATGRTLGLVGIVASIMNIANNIDYIVINYALHNPEFGVCRYMTIRYDKNTTRKGSILLKFEQCTKMNELNFWCKLNVLRIGAKGVKNNKSLFCRKGIKFKKTNHLKWDFNEKLMTKLASEFCAKILKCNPLHSKLIDSNWFITVYSKNNTHRVRFGLLKLPHLIKQIEINWCIKLKYNGKNIINNEYAQRKRIFNYDNISRSIGVCHTFQELKQTDTICVALDIKLLKIFDFDDNEIAINAWPQYGVV